MRCPVIADEGTPQAIQCIREEHPDDPDAHDFSAQGNPGGAVDGGQSWQSWIETVHAVRAALLNRVRDDGTSVYGLVQWDEAQFRAIVEAVGLTVTEDNEVVEGSGGSVRPG